MKDLVKIERNKNYGLVVSSRVIAKELGKRHKNVIRDLGNILKTPVNSIGSNLSRLIFPNNYKDSKNRTYREYLLTKDGFILYMFNIQGHNDFKMAYINEFNRMKAELEGETVQPVKVKGLTFRGERVITLTKLADMIDMDRNTIRSRLDNRTVISGTDMVEFKQENKISNCLSCVTLLDADETAGVLEKLKVPQESREEVMKYFTPDMNLIRNSRHWKRLNDMRNEMCEAGKEFLNEMKNIDRSIERLHKIKNTILGSVQVMNYDMYELEK